MRETNKALAALASCVAMLAACASPSPAREAGAVIVHAPAGALAGRAQGALNVFKGVPYAEPPTGAARWRAPQPKAPWRGVHDAGAFGPACVQLPRAATSVYAYEVGPVSEDCLTLNIWAPANASGAPVLVWIHGGSLVSGSSNEPMYDGARLAARGVVFVSINYRLGVLGFLAHPELSAESPLGVSGNYGLLDQIEALRWIQRNIAAFGGDPGNVTIFGESAGALSASYLLAAPQARDLFAKAIIQSTNFLMVPHLRETRFGVGSAESAGIELGAALDAPSLAALRGLDGETLSAAAMRAGYSARPTIDGAVLPRQLIETLDHGEQAPAPVLVGLTSGEIRTFPALAPRPLESHAAYVRAIRESYGDLADEFLRLYPGADQQEDIYAATRDGISGWAAERLARAQTALGAPAYLYYFDHSYPAADEAGLRAFHASELPYIFGALDTFPVNWPPVPDEPGETSLSDAMIGYWTSFATSGAPSAASAPDWPAYAQARNYMLFAGAPQPRARLNPGAFELVDALTCRRRHAGEAWTWRHGLAVRRAPQPPTPC